LERGCHDARHLARPGESLRISLYVGPGRGGELAWRRKDGCRMAAPAGACARPCRLQQRHGPGFRRSTPADRLDSETLWLAGHVSIDRRSRFLLAPALAAALPVSR